jgi:cell wall-active antibiotic response 4TMS protein YvqF
MANSPRALVRAVRGPILLITVGALFTLDYFGHWPFYRTWPVLLIVFGALKLLERMSPVSEQPPQDRIPGGLL